MLMEESLQQDSKAVLPILVTDDEMLMDMSSLQPEKAQSPMFVTSETLTILTKAL